MRSRLLGRVALVLLLALSASAATAGAAERVIVAFGDSLTAGLGVPRQQTYPALLAERLRREGFDYQVVNAGVSGDTTSGGLRRVESVLRRQPEIVIIEFGANDGLRGQPLELMRKNLTAMIERFQDAGVKVVLTGMRLPANYGPVYTNGFAKIYPDLAKRYGIAFMPFFLDGVALEPGLNQDDGLHPTAAGYAVIVNRLWPVLKPLLSK
jgi:acyl-CoA thioesterase-1